MNRKIRTTRGAAAALGGMALGLTGLAMLGAATPVPASAPVEVAEDSADWNCFTMGNQSCGSMRTFPGENGTTGAVLPGGFGFDPTVAWSNGVVWDEAPRWWRYVSWRDCVDGAEGTDASLAQCDEDWQVAGERFDMSEAHCYAEAWINDDPDAAMLRECDA